MTPPRRQRRPLLLLSAALGLGAAVRALQIPGHTALEWWDFALVFGAAHLVVATGLVVALALILRRLRGLRERRLFTSALILTALSLIGWTIATLAAVDLLFITFGARGTATTVGWLGLMSALVAVGVALRDVPGPGARGDQARALSAGGVSLAVVGVMIALLVKVAGAAGPWGATIDSVSDGITAVGAALVAAAALLVAYGGGADESIADAF